MVREWLHELHKRAAAEGKANNEFGHSSVKQLGIMIAISDILGDFLR